MSSFHNISHPAFSLYSAAACVIKGLVCTKHEEINHRSALCSFKMLVKTERSKLFHIITQVYCQTFIHEVSADVSLG